MPAKDNYSEKVLTAMPDELKAVYSKRAETLGVSIDALIVFYLMQGVDTYSALLKSYAK